MKRLLKIFASLVILWALGLLVFIANVPSALDRNTQFEPSPDASKHTSSNHGIVVFTGGGGTRISKAMTLLKQGNGARLLISGVHPETTYDHLQELWGGNDEQYACCVDLGIQAQTTRGNAAELLDWATTHQMDRIILVTSDFHMPRSLAETRVLRQSRGLKDKIAITAYSAPSDHIKTGALPNSFRSWKIISIEYSKFIMARTRHITGKVFA